MLSPSITKESQQKKLSISLLSLDISPTYTVSPLSYIDDEGNDVTKKVPTEIQDYGLIYDNLYDAIFNNAEKVVKDQEVVAVLHIIEEATKAAKEV